MVNEVWTPNGLSVEAIRGQLKNNCYIGDVFEALKYLLAEYDKVCPPKPQEPITDYYGMYGLPSIPFITSSGP